MKEYKYTYRITGVKGDIVFTDFLDGNITIQIEGGNSMSSTSDCIRKFLADNHLKCDRVILEKIELN